MGVSRVIIEGETVLDLANDTVTSHDLINGVTAHNSAGELITGTSKVDDAGFAASLAIALKRNYLFSNNKTLSLSKIPEGTTTIGEYCFYGCTGITISEIPASVTTINNSAFTGCTGITSLTFKGTPSSIPSWCFGNNSNLKDIYVPWSEGAVANAPWGASSATIHYDSAV